MSQSTAGKPHCCLDTQHHNSTGTPAWVRHALAHAVGAENKKTELGLFHTLILYFNM